MKLKKLILTSLSMFLLLNITGCGTKEESENDEIKETIEKIEENAKGDTKKAEKNIKVTDSKILNDNIYIFVENKNKENVSAEFEVSYYDENKKFLGSKTSYGNISGNSETIVEIYEVPAGSKKYEIKFSVDYCDSEKTYEKELKAISNKTSDQIAIQVENTTGVDLEEIVVAVLFYKKDKFVAYDEDSEFDVKAGKKASLNVYLPSDENFNDIEFDRYEVIITSASKSIE